MFENSLIESDPPPSESRPHIPNRPEAFVAFVLIGLNILMFVVMIFCGVSPFEPTAKEVLPWGANFGPMTLHGQPWRLLTACFLHFGVLHLGMNMYILFQVGPFTEMLFGKVRFFLLYLLAGVAGNILGLYIHPLTVGAGASGAVFGVYGALLAFLLIERGIVPTSSSLKIAQSAGIFLVYNLFFGLADGKTDLSAHIGGFVAGFVGGCLLARPHVSRDVRLPVVRIVSVAVVATGLIGVSLYSLARRGGGGGDWVQTVLTSPYVPVGNKGRVIYTGSATKTDAEKLATGMEALNFFSSPNVIVLLSRGTEGTSISLPIGNQQASYETIHSKSSKLVDGKTVIFNSDVVRTAPWDDPKKIGAFNFLGVRLAPLVGGAPIHMVLLDAKGEPRRTIDIRMKMLMVGTQDQVWYSGSVTEQDAQTVGKALLAAGFLHDRGAVVMLDRGRSGTEVSFLVGDGTWNNPRVSAGLQIIVRRMAPLIGGLPVTGHLVDAQLEQKGTFVVQ